MADLLKRLLFNLWYFRSPPWDTGESPPELLDFIDSHPPRRALDLGCGTGTNVITLAKHGWEATGVDFAARAIQIARKKARRAEVKASFLVDDVTRLEGVSDPFDLILDMGCFHNLGPTKTVDYVQNLVRLLAPGGAYLMYGHLKQPGESGPGLTSEDVILLMDRLILIERQDGTERGQRPSAWFTFQKPV